MRQNPKGANGCHYCEVKTTQHPAHHNGQSLCSNPAKPNNEEGRKNSQDLLLTKKCCVATFYQ